MTDEIEETIYATASDNREIMDFLTQGIKVRYTGWKRVRQQIDMFCMSTLCISGLFIGYVHTDFNIAVMAVLLLIYGVQHLMSDMRAQKLLLLNLAVAAAVQAKEKSDGED